MLLGIILVAVLAVVCGSGTAWWIRLAAANGRTVGAPAGELDDLFRGGVMGRHVLTSGSLARLEIYGWGVRLRGTMISHWIVPTWEATYDELAMAELVALPASRIAVWLRVTGEPHPIGFLTERSLEILTLLQGHGVPVNRSVTQVRRVEELYQ